MVKDSLPSSFLPWLIPWTLLACWFLASQWRLMPPYLLPGPWEVGKAGYLYVLAPAGTGPYSGRFLNDLQASLVRVGAGFSLAVFLGLPLGLLSGRMAWFNLMMGNFINALRAVPGITWLPLAMVWFGIGIKTTVFLIALAAFFPVYLNAAQGARQINPLLLQAGAMLGAGKLTTVFKIIIPGAMPHILSGLRLGLGISWAYLVLGELTGVPDGLGAVIMDARMLGQVDMIIVGMMIIALIGRLSDRLFTYLLRYGLKRAGLRCL